jgi:hypothetical protein
MPHTDAQYFHSHSDLLHSCCLLAASLHFNGQTTTAIEIEPAGTMLPPVIQNLGPVLIKTFSVVLIGYVMGYTNFVPPSHSDVLGSFLGKVDVDGTHSGLCTSKLRCVASVREVHMSLLGHCRSLNYFD